MKKIFGIFIIALISIGIADFLQGIILTLMYTPNSYTTGYQEMETIIQYVISAIIVTLTLWSVHKVKNLLKGSKSSVENIVKSHVFKQFVGIITLFLFAFIVDYYILYIEIFVLKQLIMSIAISILLFVFNQLIYNYAKKNEDRLLQHKIWNKMFVLILMLLMISFVVFILLFFMTPLDVLISSQTWIMFIIVYYFLFFINLFVLSIVHKVVNSSMKIEKKLLITWASSSLLVAFILFILPSF